MNDDNEWDDGPRRLPCPTPLLPGTEGKILVMMHRYARGVHIHHPLDGLKCVRLDPASLGDGAGVVVTGKGKTLRLVAYEQRQGKHQAEGEDRTVASGSGGDGPPTVACGGRRADAATGVRQPRSKDQGRTQASEGR